MRIFAALSPPFCSVCLTKSLPATCTIQDLHNPSMGSHPDPDPHSNLDDQREQPDQFNDFLKRLKLEAKRKAHEKVKGIEKYRNTDRSNPVFRKRMDARISQENHKFYKDLLEQKCKEFFEAKFNHQLTSLGRPPEPEVNPGTKTPPGASDAAITSTTRYDAHPEELRKENEFLRLQIAQDDIAFQCMESQYEECKLVSQRNVQLQLENESLKAGRTVLPSALTDVISSLCFPFPAPSDALSSGSTYATDGLGFQITNVSPVEETSPIQGTDNVVPNLPVGPVPRKVRISVEVEVPQSVSLSQAPDPPNIPAYLLPGAQFQQTQQEANNDNLNVENEQP